MSFLSRCALALSCLVLGTAVAQTIPLEITTALARARVPQDAVSLLVMRLDGAASARLSHRAQASMSPASVMKLVTTFAALDQLGPAFTWKTRFYIDGTLDNGVINGNLVIRGGGDPKWVIERIEADFKALQQRGVREVRGDIVLDSSVFDVAPRDPGEFDGEPMRPYNSAPDGLLVNFKAVILSFTPDPVNHTARVTSEPPMAGLVIDSSVAMNSDDCADWRGALRADFSDVNRISFNGNYSVRCGEQVWPVAYIDPSSYARRVVAALYTASGGVLGGSVREGRTPHTARLILKVPSLPLSDIIADVNKYSNNVMAQQVFLTLSAQKRGKGTFAASREVVGRWWRETFAATGAKPPVLDNGSGLSRSGRISAQSLGQLLRTAAAHPAASVFAQSLSIAGVDGTAARMRERGTTPEALGNAQLKTGTLRDVAAVAGYATGRSGRRYAVVGLINHPNAPAARPALDALVEWTVKDQ